MQRPELTGKDQSLLGMLEGEEASPEERDQALTALVLQLKKGLRLAFQTSLTAAQEQRLARAHILFDRLWDRYTDLELLRRGLGIWKRLGSRPEQVSEADRQVGGACFDLLYYRTKHIIQNEVSRVLWSHELRTKIGAVAETVFSMLFNLPLSALEEDDWSLPSWIQTVTAGNAARYARMIVREEAARRGRNRHRA